mmetsp:Transcript_22589/g.54365  ORF Transcript_22589/g.54365 Transcript_22589/m.54365 type:complete len:104 (+) Transcript_22589:1347-1658(+)
MFNAHTPYVEHLCRSFSYGSPCAYLRFSAAFPLSPSTFVTLLSSPDLRMLMSPDAPNCSTPLLLTTPNMGKIDELAAPDAQQDSFTQFKRRQQSSYWPSDLTV